MMAYRTKFITKTTTRVKVHSRLVTAHANHAIKVIAMSDIEKLYLAYTISSKFVLITSCSVFVVCGIFMFVITNDKLINHNDNIVEIQNIH